MITPVGRETIEITSSLTFLATVFVILRFISRRRTSVQLDDWLCLASLVVAYGFLVATVLMITIGNAGHNSSEYDQKTAQIFAQSYIATDVLATACLSLTKISILFTYGRIFSIKPAFSRVSWIIGGLVFGHFVLTTCGLIFPAKPVEAEWKPWIPHTHINYRAFWISFCTINLALDVAVLCLPQPIIWSLQMTLGRKIQLCLVLLLGSLVCVASAIRIYVVTTLDMDNLTASLLPAAKWNTLEMITGIICTCLPMMPALFYSLVGRSENKSYATATSDQSGNQYRRAGPRKLEEANLSSVEVQLIERNDSRG